MQDMVFFATDAKCGVLFQERVEGALVKASFEPESDMSAAELAKVMTLILVAKEGVNVVKPIQYIRANNLERHFRFTA